MSTFFLFIIGIFVLSFFSGGGKKKHKAQKTKSRYSTRKGTAQQLPQAWNPQDQTGDVDDGPAPFNPSSSAISALMRSREISQNASSAKAEQDKGQSQGFYELSKARAEKVRREAASKLEYDGLPEIQAGENVQRFETSAKSHVSTDVKPLVRDMNAARRRALSSERAVSAFTLKHLLLYSALGGCALLVLSRV